MKIIGYVVQSLNKEFVRIDPDAGSEWFSRDAQVYDLDTAIKIASTSFMQSQGAKVKEVYINE